MSYVSYVVIGTYLDGREYVAYGPCGEGEAKAAIRACSSRYPNVTFRTRSTHDRSVDVQCSQTASKFATLAGLRGITATVVWNGEQYLANDTPCGTSVHGLYDWLNAQPGVKP